jgi:hypothetical protein
MVTPSAVMSVPISCVGEHLLEAHALDVEDLAAQREDRLGLAVAALLGRAACGVALDDVELALGGSRSWQSASLPGSVAASSTPLRCTSSRALRAASRACAASTHLSTMRFATCGFCSSKC